MTNTPEADLFSSCIAVAREVLWRNGAASSDVVETLAQKFLAIAQEYQDFVRRQRETDNVIAHAVQYIAHVHAVPAAGTDTSWFRQALSVLMELAVPNAGLTEDAARLLPCIQQGIRESLSDVPVSRNVMRLVDEDAARIRRLQNAGTEHGIASEILDLLEKLFHGDPLTQEDERFFYLAAVAAPVTRQERQAHGLDKV